MDKIHAVIAAHQDNENASIVVDDSPEQEEAETAATECTHMHRQG